MQILRIITSPRRWRRLLPWAPRRVIDEWASIKTPPAPH